jgi:putative ATP-dependent endonuclease of OLD family
VLGDLVEGNNQVIVTTHSPLFVSGDGFENVRLVRRPNPNAGAVVSALTYQALCGRLRDANGEDPERPVEGLVAKIHQALQPGIAEMLFARVPVLVEGLEDVAYITTQMYLSGLWSDFRRLGCHLVPVNGKDKLVQPLAIATALALPVFVIFDADGDAPRPEHRAKHERDNRALQSLLGIAQDPFPTSEVWGDNHAIWPTKLTETVKHDFGADHARFLNPARNRYAQEGGLEKNGLFIADWMKAADDEGVVSPTLRTLCENIIRYATNPELT